MNESTTKPGEPGITAGKADGGSLVYPLVMAILLSVLVGVAVAAPDYLPTNDGPEHVFASHAARHLDDPTTGYGRFLRLGASFVLVGFDSLFGFWERFLSWRGALRASLVVMTLFWAWGVMALAAAVGGRKRIWLGLFGFAAALQWQLYMGFFSFYLATGFGFYVLALALWKEDWNWLLRVAIAMALLIQASLHPMPALCTLMVTTLLAACRKRRRSLLHEAIGLALMASPCVAFVLATNAGPRLATMHNLALPLAERAGIAVSAFVSGPAWRSWALPICALLGGALAIAGKQWREDGRRWAVLASGFASALVATLAPFHMSIWQFFNMRFSPLAAILLVVLLPIERWPSLVRRVGLVLLLVYATASNVWALGYNLRLRQASDDLLSGLQAPIHRRGMRLPLIIEPRAGEPQRKSSRTFPYATANWNIGSIYAVQQGGVPAWTFAETDILDPVVWRWPEQKGLRPPRPERGFEWWLSEPETLVVPGARKAAVSHLLSYAPYYEDVIFYGRPEEVDWLRQRHFAIDYERGGLAIARFRACPAALAIFPGTRGHAATILQFGWAPSTQPTFSTTMAAENRTQAPRRWSVPESPCGDVWFRVLFDNDDSGKLSPGDDTCVEASPQGVLNAHIAAPSALITCHPGRRLLPPAPAMKP